LIKNKETREKRQESREKNKVLGLILVSKSDSGLDSK
tara:strand:+ start:4022 stop:4132 length:111 start_codon:yes stop_codon:yes gene_type:complete